MGFKPVPAHRQPAGWTYNEKRDNALKRHNLLVKWSELSPMDQDKDRVFVTAIPRLLEVAKHKAMPRSVAT